MKMIVALTILTFAAVLQAQDTSMTGQAIRDQSFVRGQYYATKIHMTPAMALPAKAHYGGMAGDMAQLKQPLQMLNPAAPESYGTGEQNVTRDLTTHQVTGLKLFAVNF